MSADPALLIEGSWTDASLTDRLLATVDERRRLLKMVTLACAGLTLLLFAAIGYSMLAGTGVWGNDIPVAWGFPIIDFVFWIGIGHAGTFISAILLLLEQRWRSALNRVSEAMTLFALVQAGLMPLLHLGRPWFFYWLVPYPSTMDVWPQFQSPLTWDIAAVFTYTTVSVLFFYLGLLPDLASARDRASTRRARIAYGCFALGWRGSVRHWKSYKSAQLLLAGLATPLVISVHSIVSLDFAVAKLPGWHSTIFPPYFVAGAILSGFAMVALLVIPLRHLYRLEQVITRRHFDLIGKLLLVTSLIVASSYASELYMAWYSGENFEKHIAFHTRPLGPYAWLYWAMLVCNVVVPQALWSSRVRQHPVSLFVVSLFVLFGMWVERFVLIVTSQHQDYLPSSWGHYAPSLVDGAILLGTFGFFLLLLIGMMRLVPWVAVFETKELAKLADRAGKRE